MSNFQDVKTFMKTFGQIVRTKPQFPDEKTMQLRLDLIKEEINEGYLTIEEAGIKERLKKEMLYQKKYALGK